MVQMNTTSSAAIGRRRTLRSPLLNIGTSSRSAPKTSGPATMMMVSRWCGAIASTAKYQRKYQSGRGYASRRLGSGGGPSSGGPTMTARSATVATIAAPKTTSRQAASGQKGTPSRRSSSS